MNESALAEIATMPDISTFELYLIRRGGRDTLEFDTPTQASDAAHTLRQRHPSVKVEARFCRVFLTL